MCLQYNKIRVIVGFFVLVLFIAVVGAGGFLLEEKGFFEKKYEYYFVTQSANSFSVGMPLKFSGFDIGVIDNISLQDDGTVLMRFLVNEKNRKWISVGTVLLMKKPLIGSPHIEVQSNRHTRALQPGATLKIIRSDDINDMISKLEPVVEKLINIIDNIETITKYLTSGDSDLLKSLKNLEVFSEKLVKNDSLLTSVTGDSNATKRFINSIDNLALTMQNIKNITLDIKKISASLDKKIVQPSSSSLKELELIMKDVKRKLDMIDGTVESIGSSHQDIENMKETLRVAIEKSNQVLNKVDAILGDEKSAEVKLP